MTKLLNNVSVKLGIVFVCGIISGCILYYNVVLPLAKVGILVVPFILYPFYLLYTATKIAWELFE